MTGGIRSQCVQGVVEITLDRRERRNALSRALLEAVREELCREHDAEVSALVLCGAGGCFSAGADLEDLSGGGSDVAMDDAIEAVVRGIGDAPVPVIAAIEGACIGAGLDLALACDVRVAGATAFFELPAARLGVLYNPRAIARMRAVVGSPALARLLLLGERLDAEAAVRAGLVSHLTAAGAARDVAMRLAHEASASVPPVVAATKALLRALDDGSFDARAWAERRAQILDSPERGAALAKAKARRADS